MAPEQARGERVDQRADVYAIGTMLWELCSLERLPPAFTGQRRHILQRSGVDDDLMTIIERAVDPDPDRRYSDASDLAADLRAFRAGTRIASRHYSPWAVLTHWVRRHRTLSLSILILTGIALVVTGLYIRNVTHERDRADTALQRSEKARDELTLEHAALLLQSDPTAALATLNDYHGPPVTRARQIAAEARGRGVARSILNSHSDVVRLAVGMPDGSVLSVADDRRIALTRDGAITVLAQDLAIPTVIAYSAAQQLLAYSTTAPAASLLEIGSHRVSHISTTRAYAFAFSNDGSLVAVLDDRSDITVWTTAFPAQIAWRRQVPRAGAIAFASNSLLIAALPDGYTTISLQHGKDFTVTVSTEAFAVSGDRLATGDQRGNVSIFSLPSLHLEGSISTCKSPVRDVSILRKRPVILFVCQDGSAGVVDYQPLPSIRLRFPTEGSAFGIRLSEDESLAIFFGDSNIAYVHDLERGLTQHYQGQARISSAGGPTSRYPLLLTGDINGTIRSWEPPDAAARIVLRASSPVLRAAVSPDCSVLAAGTNEGTVTLVRLQLGTLESKSIHTSLIQGVRFITDQLVVTYGLDGKVIVWNTKDFSVVRRFTEHHSRVEDLEFIEHENELLSVGDDGRLLAWSPTNDRVMTMFSTQRPLMNLETLTKDSTAVVSDSAGMVWHVQAPGKFSVLRATDGDAVTVLRASPSGHLLVVGTAGGAVTIFQTTTWKVVTSITMGGPLRQAAFSPDGTLLALASKAHDIRLLSLLSSGAVQLADVNQDARDLAFSPDGRLLAIISADGVTWFHSLADGSWTYSRDHDALPYFGRFSRDGRFFFSSDNLGTVVLRDVAMTLDRSSSLYKQSAGVTP
jgi:WD40 repeat protein